MNYSRHRVYNQELKKLIDKHGAELNKLSGEKRQKFEDQLKRQAMGSSQGKEIKEEVKAEVEVEPKKVSKKKNK